MSERMTRRVKPGYDELLHGRIRAYEEDGFLVLDQREEAHPSIVDIVRLPVEACETLGMTAVLEDVPEPGERLYLAATEADGNAKPIPWRDKSEPSKARWREKAAELGIKESR